MGSLGSLGLLYKASIKYIDLLEGSYDGNCPPEIVLDNPLNPKTLNPNP